MMMFLVVPGKECVCPGTCIRLATKATGIVGTILQSLELGFGVRIIVGNMRARMGFGHTKIRQKKSHRLGSHGTASVSMDRELIWLNPLSSTGFGNQFFRQSGRFAFCDHPA